MTARAAERVEPQPSVCMRPLLSWTGRGGIRTTCARVAVDLHGLWPAGHAGRSAGAGPRLRSHRSAAAPADRHAGQAGALDRAVCGRGGSGSRPAVRQAPVIACDETSARVMGQTCCLGRRGWRTGSRSTRAAVPTDFLQGATPAEVWVSDRYGAQARHGTDASAVPGASVARCPSTRSTRATRYSLPASSVSSSERSPSGAGVRRWPTARSCSTGTTSTAGSMRCSPPRRPRGPDASFGTAWPVPGQAVRVRHPYVSERRLRPSVISRKVTNGFRSVWGAALYAAICSVIATAALRGLSEPSRSPRVRSAACWP